MLSMFMFLIIMFVEMNIVSFRQCKGTMYELLTSSLKDEPLCALDEPNYTFIVKVL